jgi:hypothetical protein
MAYDKIALTQLHAECCSAQGHTQARLRVSPGSWCVSVINGLVLCGRLPHTVSVLFWEGKRPDTDSVISIHYYETELARMRVEVNRSGVWDMMRAPSRSTSRPISMKQWDYHNNL